MVYQIRIMPQAERDLAAIYQAINAESSLKGHRWFERLERAILTLEEDPTRCPVTTEDRLLRHLLYGKKPHIFRVIYRVVESHGR